MYSKRSKWAEPFLSCASNSHYFENGMDKFSPASYLSGLIEKRETGLSCRHTNFSFFMGHVAQSLGINYSEWGRYGLINFLEIASNHFIGRASSKNGFLFWFSRSYKLKYCLEIREKGILRKNVNSIFNHWLPCHQFCWLLDFKRNMYVFWNE